MHVQSSLSLPSLLHVAPKSQTLNTGLTTKHSIHIEGTQPYIIYTVSQKKEPSYFCLQLGEKSVDFNALFTFRFNDE